MKLDREDYLIAVLRGDRQTKAYAKDADGNFVLNNLKGVQGALVSKTATYEEWVARMKTPTTADILIQKMKDKGLL